MNDLVKVKQPKALSLKQMVDIETRNRAVMTEYIAKHMKKGVDYGGIHIAKNCQFQWAPENCHNEKHFSKDSLFKAGAEKVASLLKLRPEIIMDKDAWEMAGSPQGLFFFKCRLYSRQNNELVAEGMGACSVDEKKGNPNNAIKIGKKRAFVDAVLSAGALSDFFTQDLEDMIQEKVQVASTQDKTTKLEPVEEDIPTSLLATLEQQQKIKEQLAIKGYSLKQLVGKYDINNLDELTLEQADTIVSNLKKLPDTTLLEAPITEGDYKEFEESLT